MTDVPKKLVVIENLPVLYATRQAFVATKSSKKLKVALWKSQSNQGCSQDFPETASKF